WQQADALQLTGQQAVLQVRGIVGTDTARGNHEAQPAILFKQVHAALNEGNEQVPVAACRAVVLADEVAQAGSASAHVFGIDIWRIGDDEVVALLLHAEYGMCEPVNRLAISIERIFD